MHPRKVKPLALRVAAFSAVVAFVALPVAASAPDDQYGFFVAGDATITDTHTTLTWQRTVGAATQFDDAPTVCGGATRLPTLKELLTIVDEEPHQEYFVTKLEVRYIDKPAFPKTPRGPFWSSSVTLDGNKAYTVDFETGLVGLQDVGFGTAYVRCVKGPTL